MVDLFNSGKVEKLEAELAKAKADQERLGLLSIVQLEEYKASLDASIAETRKFNDEQLAVQKTALDARAAQIRELDEQVVTTQELAILQEVGIYEYRHPLDTAAAYQEELAQLKVAIKHRNKPDGGAIYATTNWTVNGSTAQGSKMVRDFSKLMLRAFNAEADNLVRGLKPYKLDASVERLTKVAATIERLGKTMDMRISPEYLGLRIRELEWTADFRNKQAEEKEQEKAERERLREEKKLQQEIAREREKLEKERQHYLNALAALEAKGDTEAAERIRADLALVDQKVADVDYRAANQRAGFVYIISNIGSFGEDLIKVGLTRRLDPSERVRELSDASVPFNFDTHAIHFSDDAVGVEAEMHRRLADRRVNMVNMRREFFRASPVEAKALLAELAGEILQFEELAEAAEFRQSESARAAAVSADGESNSGSQPSEEAVAETVS